MCIEVAILFDEIYEKALLCWPPYIDVDNVIPAGDGYLVPCLTKLYDDIIESAHRDDLIDNNLHWAIFTAIHKSARSGQRTYLDDNIRGSVIKKFLSDISFILNRSDEILSSNELAQMHILNAELSLLLAEKSPGVEPGL